MIKFYNYILDALESTKFQLNSDPTKANEEWDVLRKELNKKIYKNLKKKTSNQRINSILIWNQNNWTINKILCIGTFFYIYNHQSKKICIIFFFIWK